MNELFRDVRYALRRLARAPLFALAAAATLAIAIGANSTVFSVVDGVLLEPLPYEEPDRLVSLGYAAPGLDIEELSQSTGLHFTYLDENRSFENVGMWLDVSVAITGVGAPAEMEAILLTHTMLPLLRVRPAIGRGFDAQDDTAGAPPTVLLGHGYWQTRFGGDPAVIGERVRIDGQPREIIGIMPAGLRLSDSDPAVYLPFRFAPANLFVGNFMYQGVARLRPGVAIEQASADVARMIPRAVERFPGGFTEAMLDQARLAPRLLPLKEQVVGDVGTMLWVLLGAAGVVLLIACVNIANLFLVRASERRTDVAVRAALGASRGALAREFLTESVALGLLGGAGGLLLAHGGVALLQVLAPDGLPRLAEIAIGPLVLLFTLGLALAAGLLFGLLSLRRDPSNLVGILREGGRGVGAGKRHSRLRETLTAAQIALAMLLLVGAGLMIRTLLALGEVRPGFERPEEVLTVGVGIPFAEIEEPERVVLAQEQMLRNLDAIPGVASVGASSHITMDATGSFTTDWLFIEAFPTPPGQMPAPRRNKWVLPGYFETMQNPVLLGRSITWADIHARARVAVITENLALEHWDRAAEAIGQRIRESPVPGSEYEPPWREIIGVVGDIRDDGVAEDPVPTVYWPVVNRRFWGQDLWVRRTVTFVIRSQRLHTAGFMDEVARAIWSVNPNLPLAAVQTLDRIRGRSMARISFALVVLMTAAAAALLLGAVGVYGVTSYAVTQRRHEIGVRMALGAQRRDVSRLVLRRTFVLAALGTAAGAAAALGLTRWMSTLLYGVSPVDPLTFAAVAVVVAAIALVASYVPAHRAARVNPVTALRAE